LRTTKTETSSKEEKEDAFGEMIEMKIRNSDFLRKGAFGYLLRLYLRILLATLMSMPSNVKLERNRWNMRRHMSQIGRRSPSVAIHLFSKKVALERSKIESPPTLKFILTISSTMSHPVTDLSLSVS